MWPDLINFRRAAFPALDRAFKDQIKFSFEKYENEFAGVSDMQPAQLRKWMHDHSNIYVNNFAALKYISGENGDRVYEVGSYAWRPDGRFSKWQVHLMLFPHEEGTAILAHREPSPLAGMDDGPLQTVVQGLKHYFAPPDQHQPAEGIEKARQLLDLDTDTDFNKIRKKHR